MTTFFEKMRRLVTGEPVYRPGESTDDGPDGPVYEYNDELAANKQQQASQYTPNQAAPQPTSAGGKITKDFTANPPVVVVHHFECHEKQDHMEVNLFLQNNSSDTVWVERVELFGKHFNIEHELKPGEDREFLVYNGPYMKDSAYTHAAIDYRASDGNYFSARHTVEYQEDQQGSGRYVPFRFRFFPPVKDI